jgi:flavin reductase (DIM6/NTAB) family NADH-FMN oxidoreductase RutF
MKCSTTYGQLRIMTTIDDASPEPGEPGPAAVSPADLREAMGHFATGVTVITSVGEDGEPVGTTANAVTSLSLEPPLVLVCFDLKSATLTAIRSHGAFAVNVLGQRQRQLSANFAKRGLAAVWDGVTHHRGPTGSPRLADVIAVVECTVEQAMPGGDHEIVIGRVQHVETNSEGATPLLFWRGRYGAMDAQAATEPADGWAHTLYSW